MASHHIIIAYLLFVLVAIIIVTYLRIEYKIDERERDEK